MIRAAGAMSRKRVTMARPHPSGSLSSIRMRSGDEVRAWSKAASQLVARSNCQPESVGLGRPSAEAISCRHRSNTK